MPSAFERTLIYRTVSYRIVLYIIINVGIAPDVTLSHADGYLYPHDAQCTCYDGSLFWSVIEQNSQKLCHLRHLISIRTRLVFYSCAV